MMANNGEDGSREREAPGIQSSDRCNLLCSRGLHPCMEEFGHELPCPPCTTEVELVASCPHSVTYYCNELDDVEVLECMEPVMKTRRCGHDTVVRCSDTLEMIELIPCEESIITQLECGHGAVLTTCSEGPPTNYECKVLISPERSCGHGGKVFCSDRKVAGDSASYPCREPCKRKCGRGHRCTERCGDPCPPCMVMVEVILNCTRHHVRFTCSTYPNQYTKKCEEVCGNTLECSHKCPKPCHKFVAGDGKRKCPSCRVVVELTLSECEHTIRMSCEASKLANNFGTGRCGLSVPNPEPGVCGHIFDVPCHLRKKLAVSARLHLIFCKTPCNTLMTCGHVCKGTCRECSNGKLHVSCTEPCGKLLVCGHTCESPCSSVCPPCPKQCGRKCQHSSCMDACGFPCIPCIEPVERCELECEHHQGCGRKYCIDPCTVPPCELPCPKMLPCGHPCISFCGEYCPTLCKFCNTENLLDGIFDGSTQIEPEHRFLQLECGHCIEYESLKSFLEAEPEDGEMVRKACPLCRQPIWRLIRFFELLVKNDQEMRTVGMRIFYNSDQPLDHKINRLVQMYHHRTKYPPYVTRYVSTSVRSSEIPPQFVRFDNHIGLLMQRITMRAGEVGVEKFKTSAGVVDRVEEVINWILEQEQILFDFFLKYVKEEKNIRQVIEETLEWLKNRRFPLKSQEVEDLNRAFVRVRDVASIVDRMVRYPSDRRPRFHASTSAQGLVAFKQAFDAAGVHAAYTQEHQDRFLAFRTMLDEEIDHSLGVTEEETRMIVQAIGGPAGRWFRCPRGHPYIITECGGAMEQGTCNECGAVIGGGHHRMIEGNTLATEMDGALQPAWPTAFRPAEDPIPDMADDVLPRPRHAPPPPPEPEGLEDPGNAELLPPPDEDPFGVEE